MPTVAVTVEVPEPLRAHPLISEAGRIDIPTAVTITHDGNPDGYEEIIDALRVIIHGPTAETADALDAILIPNRSVRINPRDWTASEADHWPVIDLDLRIWIRDLILGVLHFKGTIIRNPEIAYAAHCIPTSMTRQERA